MVDYLLGRLNWFTWVALAWVVCGWLPVTAWASPNAMGKIPALNATVESVLFYECSRDLPPLKDRVYKSSFNASQARFIAWELRLQHPLPAGDHNFRITAKFYDQNGRMIHEQYIDTYIKPTWPNSNHSSGYGGDNPGFFSPGTYRVELFINNAKVAANSFQVTPAAIGTSGDVLGHGPPLKPKSKAEFYKRILKDLSATKR